MATIWISEALQERGETPPGVDPESQKIRSASVLLPRDKPYNEAAKDALKTKPGKAHVSV